MEKIIDSPIIYWLIDDSSIPTEKITLGSVRENNSNFKVQEIAFMNGQEIIFSIFLIFELDLIENLS